MNALPTNDALWSALKDLTDCERQLVVARIMGSLDAWERYWPETHRRLVETIASHPFVAEKLGGAK